MSYIRDPVRDCLIHPVALGSLTIHALKRATMRTIDRWLMLVLLVLVAVEVVDTRQIYQHAEWNKTPGNPGVKIRLTKKGINHLKTVGVRLLNEQIASLTGYSTQFTISQPGFEGLVTLSDVRVLHYNPPQVSVVNFLPPRYVILGLENMDISLAGAFYSSGGPFQVQGFVDGSIIGMTVALTTEFATDADGMMSVQVPNCSTVITHSHFNIDPQGPMGPIVKTLELNRNNVSKKYRGFLRTTCGGSDKPGDFSSSICVGKLIPPIAETYPNTTTSFVLLPHGLPDFQFNGDAGAIKLSTRILTYVDDHGQEKQIMVSSAEGQADVLLAAQNGHLGGDLKLNRLSVRLHRTSLAGMDPSSIEQLAPLAKTFIGPQLSQALKKGIPFPLKDSITFVEPQLKTRDAMSTYVTIDQLSNPSTRSEYTEYCVDILLTMFLWSSALINLLFAFSQHSYYMCHDYADYYQQNEREKVEGKRPRWAPKKRWSDAVKKDLRVVAATKEDALSWPQQEDGQSKMLFCSKKEKNSWLDNREELHDRFKVIDERLQFGLYDEALAAGKAAEVSKRI
ncbi:hypothetical protein TELCIR_08967 [Teladorsagia circumcincta]|uniref:Lipid-binding serum glycoprotein C-terminal domain-containing protein n=1 Tax=Teladorsagia circumcincta TaxID=45464 RepID=A0A2G9UG46_TELCI|nr:hypothetical protein TELCIR_08967 [Teladorsagia circumcincta]